VCCFRFFSLQTAEILEKRGEVVEKKMAAEVERAKQYLRQGDKTAAAAALKRKTLLQMQLDKLHNGAMRVQEQQQSLEESLTSVQTISALQQAALAQKATLAEFKVEKVDKVMEEIQEGADRAAELQEALAMPLGPAAEIDDDALLAELEELEAQQLDEQLLRPAAIPASGMPSSTMELPSVPTTKPVKTTEDELKELEAELMAS